MPFFTISSPSSGNATQLQGRPVSATAPAAGSVLAYDGSSWRSAQGVTGPTGPQGRDGHTLYAGSGAPAANFGASGDWYVDTATANLYGPKANGSWGSAFSIQGGPTGPSVTGPTGATGATGPASRGGATVATLTGGLTLTGSSDRYQLLNAGTAARTITLPTGIASGFDFIIAETGGTYALTVQTAAAATVATVSASASRLFAFDGTTWRAFGFSSFT